jgi:alanyl aminopeptidase
MLGSLSGAFNSGDLDIATLMSISPQIIDSPDWQVATSPIAHMEFMYERIASEGQRKALELRFAEFYTGRLDETGLDFTSDREKAQLQAALVKFLAETARQPILRGELVTMARAYSGYGTDNKIHADMGNPIIIGTALGVAVDELGSQFVDHLQKLALSSTDTVVRGHAFSAIGQTKDPVKSMEVLELIFSPDLRDNEVYNILIPQMFMRETRNTAWLWFRQNIDRILKRIPENYWGQIAFVGSAFCDTDKQAEVQTFFSDRIATLTGGPRTLAKALEGIELCVAKSEHHREEMIDWLGQ